VHGRRDRMSQRIAEENDQLGGDGGVVHYCKAS